MMQQRDIRELHRIESGRRHSTMHSSAGIHSRRRESRHDARWLAFSVTCRRGIRKIFFVPFLFLLFPLIPVLFFGRSQVFSLYLSLSLSLPFPLSLYGRRLASGKLHLFVYFSFSLSLSLFISFGTYIISVFVSYLLLFLCSIFDSSSRLPHFLLYIRQREREREREREKQREREREREKGKILFNKKRKHY